MRGFLRSATHHACFSRTKRSVGWEVFGTLRRYEVEKDWHCSLKRDRSNEKLSLFFAKLAVCLIPAKNSVIYQNCKTSWYKKIKVGRLPIAKTFSYKNRMRPSLNKKSSSASMMMMSNSAFIPKEIRYLVHLCTTIQFYNGQQIQVGWNIN